jgi:hypothetical protein
MVRWRTGAAAVLHDPRLDADIEPKEPGCQHECNGVTGHGAEITLNRFDETLIRANRA